MIHECLVLDTQARRETKASTSEGIVSATVGVDIAEGGRGRRTGTTLPPEDSRTLTLMIVSNF